MDQGSRQDVNEPAQETQYCAFHPDVETGLSCSRCGRHICPRCMVLAPVGVRCRLCAQVQKTPTFDVQPSYYLRASLAGGGVAIASGLVWGGLLIVLPYSALAWVLAVGVGHILGNTVSTVTNRKRGAGLMAVAGASLLVALLSAGILTPGVFRVFFATLPGIFFLVVAFLVAINKLR